MRVRLQPDGTDPMQLDTAHRKLDTVGMARFEQFEVWALNGDKWEFAASFHDFDIASDIARARGRAVRLLHVVYENGQPVEKQVLFEIGATREHP